MSAVRIGPHLKELRIHLCQTSAASQGVRDFIQKHYVPLKRGNPEFPFLIRECSGISPRIWARYEYGREAVHNVENVNSDEVMKLVEKLASAKAP